MGRAGRGRAVRRWARLVAALALLNGSLTFVSIWPTLAVKPALQLSVDAAALVLILTLAPVSTGRTTARWLAAVWVGLIFCRYIEVSTRSLYGRSVNLYWDLQLLPDVGAMFAYVAAPRILLALAAIVVIVPLVVFLPVRWAIGQVIDVSRSPRARQVLALASVAIVLGAVIARQAGVELAQQLFAAPVSASIAEEVVEFAREASAGARRSLPPAAPVHSDLTRVRGADVMLLFVESYGVTSWERTEFQATLAPGRAALTSAIADTGRSVVTGVVESTTFGGESWLAHISLLSGIEVRDPDVNRRLMAERRDTMVTTFARAGYRTLAVMPGLHAPWPEGRFYGFDRIYGAPDLGYQGPPFGWWDVTDQFVLARTDELTRGSGTSPVFVFYPTISTHTPFTPVPPYQPDWSRLLTPTPYDGDDLQKAYEATPDWSNLGPDYARAVAYMYETLSGYLRRHSGRDLVMIVIGDHQPPALVSGEGASWNVPIHVIASRTALLDRLRGRGFRDGLQPLGPVLARMDTLTPILLDAFGDTE